MSPKSLLATTSIIPESLFPPTKFMGSKQRLLDFIFSNLEDLQCDTVLDAFSGSGSVGYEFKRRGKGVTTNDFLHFSYSLAKGVIENDHYHIDAKLLAKLLERSKNSKTTVQDNFANVFFSKSECQFLDSLRSNIDEIKNEYLRSLAIAAACRACQKKYPRGIFTVTGRRGRDGRQDFKISLEQHFVNAVGLLNSAVMQGEKKCEAHWTDIMSFAKRDFDLVYLDPPYWSPFSDNDYVRRYHFIEGYSLYWKSPHSDLSIDTRTKSRKFKSYPTPFSNRETAISALQELFHRYSNSILAVSYSSNCLPTKDEMLRMLRKVKPGEGRVKVFNADHTYSFANQGHTVGTIRNRVQEYLFVAV